MEEPQPRPGSAVNDWIKKPSPRVGQRTQEEEQRPVENEYDMDCQDGDLPNNVSTGFYCVGIPSTSDGSVFQLGRLSTFGVFYRLKFSTPQYKFIEGALGSRCTDWEIFLSAGRRDSFNEMKCELLRREIRSWSMKCEVSSII